MGPVNVKASLVSLGFVRWAWPPKLEGVPRERRRVPEANPLEEMARGTLVLPDEPFSFSIIERKRDEYDKQCKQKDR